MRGSCHYFFVCFSSTIHASRRRSHAIWTVENERVVLLSRCYRCRLDQIYGAYTAWKIFKWGYLSHRVPSGSTNDGNRVNPVCVFKELRLLWWTRGMIIHNNLYIIFDTPFRSAVAWGFISKVRVHWEISKLVLTPVFSVHLEKLTPVFSVHLEQ
jgi:hypothetical protein